MKTKIITICEWWLPLGLNWSAHMSKENLEPRKLRQRFINPDEIVELKEITLSKHSNSFVQVVLSSKESFYTAGPIEQVIQHINNH